jgi:long-subunit fatty acid transport protein
MKKSFFAVFLFVLASLPVFAQTSSPYTRIGLGDVLSSYTSRRAAMGGLGAAIEDADFISILNPASLNKLSKVRIEIGFNYNAMFLSGGGKSNYYGDAQFNGFTLAFPVSPSNGISAFLGLAPVTDVGYKTVQPSTSADAARVILEGEGGISKAYIGTSYKLPADFSIGAAFDYYFGEINYKSTTKYGNSDYTNAEFKKGIKPAGVGGTFGIISPDLNSFFKLDKLSDIKLGVSTSIFGNLKTDSLYTSVSSISEDTITKSRVDVTVPARINIGLAFKINTKYLVALDYSTQAWSNYKFNGNTSSELRNFNKFSAGFEYRQGREKGFSFWKNVILRGGFSYEQTQYKINDAGINALLFSLGASFPLSYENTIDIGFTYGMRKSSDENLYKENFLRLNVGLSLGDIWFIRMER